MIWKCRDKKIEYGKDVLIMGIVNVTPDSFSDGGNYCDAKIAVSHALELAQQGADILDLGAQSTRPGYVEISPEEEWARLEPVLTTLREKTSCPISVDTYFPYVAQKAINAGADIINDVSGVFNTEMANIVKQTGAGWVIMHNGDGGIDEIRRFFVSMAEKCSNFGIDATQLCFDMGIGFGKTYEQNLELIANIDKYRMADYPILLGTSRKRVIGASSEQPVASERVYGNISADTVAILDGVDIIRLHDVKNERQGILTAQALKQFRIDN